MEQLNSTNDGDIVAGSLKLPESDIDGDTTLTLSLEFIEHPGVLEGTFAEFGSFLCKIISRLQDERHGNARNCADAVCHHRHGEEFMAL